MSLSRRQFFRNLWSPGNAPSPARRARYETLETYVRTHLLPYDFTLTEEQERELISNVRYFLELTPNDMLFSSLIRPRIEELVEAKIESWRQENLDQLKAERAREIRNAAPDYVNTFLNFQASPLTIDQLKQRFTIDDPQQLEIELKAKVRIWIDGVSDGELQQYDVFSIKDAVFAEIRSWC